MRSSKTLTNWRQIIKVDKVDLCDFYKNGNKLPFIGDGMHYFLDLIPNAPRGCPILPGEYYTHNISLGTAEQVASEPESFRFGFPNGVYKHTITIYNDEDPMGFKISYEQLHDEQ